MNIHNFHYNSFVLPPSTVWNGFNLFIHIIIVTIIIIIIRLYVNTYVAEFYRGRVLALID